MTAAAHSTPSKAASSTKFLPMMDSRSMHERWSCIDRISKVLTQDDQAFTEEQYNKLCKTLGGALKDKNSDIRAAAECKIGDVLISDKKRIGPERGKILFDSLLERSTLKNSTRAGIHIARVMASAKEDFSTEEQHGAIVDSITKAMQSPDREVRTYSSDAATKLLLKKESWVTPEEAVGFCDTMLQNIEQDKGSLSRTGQISCLANIWQAHTQGRINVLPEPAQENIQQQLLGIAINPHDRDRSNAFRALLTSPEQAELLVAGTFKQMGLIKEDHASSTASQQEDEPRQSWFGKLYENAIALVKPKSDAPRKKVAPLPPETEKVLFSLASAIKVCADEKNWPKNGYNGQTLAISKPIGCAKMLAVKIMPPEPAYHVASIRCQTRFVSQSSKNGDYSMQKRVEDTYGNQRPGTSYQQYYNEYMDFLNSKPSATPPSSKAKPAAPTI